MADMIEVSLWRGKEEGRYQTFQVPQRENQTVLDIVTWVQRHGVSAGCTLSGPCSEVWRYDLAMGNRAIVSTAADGTEGDRIDARPLLSADGRYLTWASNSTNLVPGGTDASMRQYRKDLVSGEVRVVGDSAVYRSGWPTWPPCSSAPRCGAASPNSTVRARWPAAW